MFDRVLNTPLYKTVCKPPAFSFQKLNEKAKLAQYLNAVYMVKSTRRDFSSLCH